jgi:hypothetical protein
MRDGLDNKCQNAMLDSNEFLSKFLWHYTTRNLFSSPLSSKRLANKNPLFEVISSLVPTGPLPYQFLEGILVTLYEN